jgi:hypothetical protein
MQNAYDILVEKSLGRPSSRCEDNIKKLEGYGQRIRNWFNWLRTGPVRGCCWIREWAFGLTERGRTTKWRATVRASRRTPRRVGARSVLLWHMKLPPPPWALWGLPIYSKQLKNNLICWTSFFVFTIKWHVSTLQVPSSGYSHRNMKRYSGTVTIFIFCPSCYISCLALRYTARSAALNYTLLPTALHITFRGHYVTFCQLVFLSDTQNYFTYYTPCN